MRATGVLIALMLAVAAWPSGTTNAMPGAKKSEAKTDAVCAAPGDWVDGRTGKALGPAALFADLEKRPVVLLGETHHNSEHHHWQLHTLAALQSRTNKLVIGFEMFPRRYQDVLDQWVKGELTEKEFLKAVNWRRTWGFESGLYMPLFNFARLHRIPMVALNVDRQLVSKVGKEGWEAIPADEREGVSDPAPASKDYRRALAKVYAQKLEMRAAGGFHGTASMKKSDDKASDEAKVPTLDEILELDEFNRFVAAQLTWDRAMAQALAKARKEHDGALAVGIIGSGHLSHFHGVPHQLDALGVQNSSVLIPVDPAAVCSQVGTNYADAMFTVRPDSELEVPPQRLLLGVMLRDVQKAALVDRVVPDSVAAETGLIKGDRIIQAAGVKVTGSAGLIEIMGRHAPGTWLPLLIERSGTKIELIAKFPPRPDSES